MQYFPDFKTLLTVCCHTSEFLNFLMQSFQNMTLDIPHFELGWLGDEEDEWITSSLESEFMKEFEVKPWCTKGSIEL